MLIRNYGLFWKREDVYWGRQKSAGHLLGINAGLKKTDSVDFRQQVGFYALYDDAFQLVYFGQAGRGNGQTLYNRLKTHTTDHLAERWSRFSWFGIKYVKKSDGKLSAKPNKAQGDLLNFIDQTEAIVLAVAEPPNNLQGGRFGKAVQYLQDRDEEKLGPSPEDKLTEVYNRLQST